ncbi:MULTISPECIES: hypothetical protein [Actinosynnema]|uniref:hypothetical protein n=1 Tax=Actinosynnema TaxID=40566 RepID=UPI0020A4E175|nr:hypothetical protein [Actinosynnema pretiosum]
MTTLSSLGELAAHRPTSSAHDERIAHEEERFHQAFRAIAALGTDDRVVHDIARFLVEVSNCIENEINSEDGQSSGPAYAAEVLGGATQAQTPAMRLLVPYRV